METLGQINLNNLDFQSLNNVIREFAQKSKKNFWIAAGVGIVLLLLGIILATSNNGFGFFLIVISVILFFLWWLIGKTMIKRKMKGTVFNMIFENSNLRVRYLSKGKDTGTFLKKFLRSKFIAWVNQYEADDVFEMDFAQGKLYFGELIAYRSSGRSRTKVFDGLFYYYEVKNQLPFKEFPFTTIYPDELESTSLGKVGGALEKLNLARLNQKNIRIDNIDPDFEKYYVIWTQDPNFVYEILDEKVRTFMKERPYFIGFRDKCIYFGLETNFNLFEISFKTVLDQAVVQEHLNSLFECVNLFKNYYQLIPEKYRD